MNFQSSTDGVRALQQTILIVEDDPALRVLLSRRLQEHGFTTISAQSAPEAWLLLDKIPVDLVLLDVMLPGTSGLDMCRTIRRDSTVPIIILSARVDETDKVLGLELGADDYVPKPFSTKELIARIRAVLRRRQPDWLEPQGRQGLLRFAGWSLDQRKHELMSPMGVRVELSGAEYGLLVVLLENEQRVIGRERLLELSRTRLGDASDRSIDVLVSRLRRKLAQDRDSAGLIRTIRGTGYMFTANVDRT